jgi:hypothetical protein
MRRRSVVLCGLFLSVYALGIPLAAHAQTQEELAVHQRWVNDTRLVLGRLKASGPFRNWTLAEWVRLPWVLDPNEDISDGDIRRIAVEVNREIDLRARAEANHQIEMQHQEEVRRRHKPDPNNLSEGDEPFKYKLTPSGQFFPKGPDQ